MQALEIDADLLLPPHSQKLKVCLMVQRAPREQTQWLQQQLTILRSLKIELELSILLIADAWPARWDRVKLYFDHPLMDEKNLPAYRIGHTWLEPPAMTYLSAGMGAIRILKKIVVVGSK